MVVGSRAQVGGVELVTDLDALLDRVGAEIEGAVGDAVDREVRAAFGVALRSWPVRTGTSLRGLSLRRTGPVDWLVEGAAGYTDAIRVDGEHVARTRLAEPLAEAVEVALRRAEVP